MHSPDPSHTGHSVALVRLMDTVAPVARPTPAMHHGNNQSAVLFKRIKHRVWKNSQQVAARVPFQDWPSRRRLGDFAERRIHAFGEASTQSTSAAFVVPRIALELFKYQRMQLDPHQRNADSIWALTSARDTVSIRPERTSSIRRTASTAQNARNSASPMGSRLSTNRSASTARSSRVSAKASSATFSAEIVMPKRLPRVQQPCNVMIGTQHLNYHRTSAPPRNRCRRAGAGRSGRGRVGRGGRR